MKPPVKNHGPISSWATNAAAARFWFASFCCLLFFWFYDRQNIIDAFKRTERIVVVDESGTFHVAPLIGFDQPNKIHHYITTLATLSYLNRNPSGLDNLDLFKLVWLAPGRTAIEEELKAKSTEFEAKQIRQKAEIQTIKILKTEAERAIVVARGNLVREGFFNGERVPLPTQEFMLEIYLARNPELVTSGRLPMVVFQFRYEEKRKL